MKSFPIRLFIFLVFSLLASCMSQSSNPVIKSGDTSLNNPHKVEDSAKVIIERANQNIKDSLKQ